MNFIAVFMLVLLIMGGHGLPRFFDIFFGNPSGGHRRAYSRRPKNKPNAEGGYNDYKRICNVVNPSPYAFVGNDPYPGVPVCPP